MGFDIDSYQQSQLDTADVTINDPITGEPTDIVITVMSMDSDDYKKVQLKLQNEQIKFARKNRGKTTAERIQQEALELLVAITVNWKGVEKAGENWPFSHENARELYTKLPFIKEQVDEFVGDRRNFIRN